MRIWTLHPRYLDASGLVALWRETLLAQKVLAGETVGYRHHPQLARFQAERDPLACIAAYLSGVLREADARGYTFDRAKIRTRPTRVRLDAHDGQLLYEWRHLIAKLRARSPAVHRRWKGIEQPEPHPLFRVVRGGVEAWERR